MENETDILIEGEVDTEFEVGADAPVENAFEAANDNEVVANDNEFNSSLDTVVGSHGGFGGDWSLTYSSVGEHRFDGEAMFDEAGISLTEFIDGNKDIPNEDIANHHELLNHFIENPGEAYIFPDWIEQNGNEVTVHVTVATLMPDGRVSYETWSNTTEIREETEPVFSPAEPSTERDALLETVEEGAEQDDVLEQMAAALARAEATVETREGVAQETAEVQTKERELVAPKHEALARAFGFTSQKVGQSANDNTHPQPTQKTSKHGITMRRF